MPYDTVFDARRLTKRFGSTTALDDLTLEIPRGSLVGLIGRNGSGKTTLLHHVTGLQLPTSGECTTLGVPSGELDDDDLARIGFVAQDIRLLAWMRVKEHLTYVGSFYEHWDPDLVERVRDELELDPEQKVGALSKGDLQKLAVLLAVGHRPKLLLLDEPVSNFDPIARERLLRFLTELLTRDRECTIVISSHVLRDVERVVDRVVCLHRGRLVAHEDLDDLKEDFVEWRVTTTGHGLPESFSEPFIVRQEVHDRQARLWVRGAPNGTLGSFRTRHDVEVVPTALTLEQIFPLLVENERRPETSRATASRRPGK